MSERAPYHNCDDRGSPKSRPPMSITDQMSERRPSGSTTVISLRNSGTGAEGDRLDGEAVLTEQRVPRVEYVRALGLPRKADCHDFHGTTIHALVNRAQLRVSAHEPGPPERICREDRAAPRRTARRKLQYRAAGAGGSRQQAAVDEHG